jgi:hypothetical protein
VTALQCVGEMVIYAHEPQHAAKIHRSVTTYSVQNSISDTLSVCPAFPRPAFPPGPAFPRFPFPVNIPSVNAFNAEKYVNRLLSPGNLKSTRAAGR